VTSFLISTPESGVDSIAISYAMLDPVLTVIRPVAAFFTAVVAGITENLGWGKTEEYNFQPDLSCPVDGCCDGINCNPEAHRRHHSFLEKLKSGLRYAFTDFWEDLAGYFFIGLVLAGLITVLIPDHFFSTYLGSGLVSMLIMLVAGIPLYVCATASTPIAAALILKGVSPGAALVFLLVGPATNMASLTVLMGTLGKRSTAIYLLTIAVCALIFGLTLDEAYRLLDISPQAWIGQTAEALPHWLAATGVGLLLFISIRPFWRMVRKRLSRKAPTPGQSQTADPTQNISPQANPASVCGPT
jgi:uncharacterized membrane protein YraQ (UPF0718 family)